MVRLSPNFRFLVAFLVAVSIGGSLTACSKDKKGTPISERNTGGNGDPGGDAGDDTGGERGSDSGLGSGTEGGEKAAPKSPTDLHTRGADSQANGPQVDQDGIPAGAERELRRQEPTDESEVTVTPVSEMFFTSVNFTDRDVSVGGEMGIDDIIPAAIGEHSQWLKVAVPDYTNVHVRANHRDYPPITTLGVDPAGEFDFTDFHDDLLLNTALRLSMKTPNPRGYTDIQAGDNNSLPQEFFDQSREFAADIKDIRADITPNGKGHSVVSVKVTYDYEGSNREMNFFGILNSKKQAALALRVNDGGTPEHKFQAYLTCLDIEGEGGGCQNSMLVIEQVKGGKICKRVFAVVRQAHVGIVLGRSEYRNYFDEPNDQKREFLQYIANTGLNKRYKEGYYIPEDGDDLLLFGHSDSVTRAPVLPVPFIQRMTTRTFAVAHGYAESELLITESDYKTFRPHEMSNPSLKDGRKDILRIVGPLARPIPGKNVSALVEVDGYIQDGLNNWVQPNQGELLKSRLVGTAEIVGNDGRGTMEVKFNFGPDSLLLTFEALNIAEKDPRTIKLYPYQGKQAPEGITFENMPLPF